MKQKLLSFARLLVVGVVVILSLIGEFGIGFQVVAIVVLMTAYRREWGRKLRDAFDDEPLPPPLPQSEAGRSVSAFHEAGHAVIGWVLPGPRLPYHATIRPVHDANGFVKWKRKSSDAFGLDAALNELASIFGGAAAEREFRHPENIGWRGDLEQATDFARRMVCEWGFSGKLAPRHYDVESGLLTAEILETINAEIDRFLKEGMERALKAAKEHRDAIGRVAGMLLQHETLDEKRLREAIGFDPAT